MGSILSEEGLQVVWGQLSRLKRALRSLTEEQGSAQSYKLLAEPYEEEIAKLENEIREYARKIKAETPEFCDHGRPTNGFCGECDVLEGSCKPKNT